VEKHANKLVCLRNKEQQILHFMQELENVGSAISDQHGPIDLGEIFQLSAP